MEVEPKEGSGGQWEESDETLPRFLETVGGVRRSYGGGNPLKTRFAARRREPRQA